MASGPMSIIANLPTDLGVLKKLLDYLHPNPARDDRGGQWSGSILKSPVFQIRACHQVEPPDPQGAGQIGEKINYL